MSRSHLITSWFRREPGDRLDENWIFKKFFVKMFISNFILTTFCHVRKQTLWGKSLTVRCFVPSRDCLEETEWNSSLFLKKSKTEPNRKHYRPLEIFWCQPLVFRIRVFKVTSSFRSNSAAVSIDHFARGCKLFRTPPSPPPAAQVKWLPAV